MPPTISLAMIVKDESGQLAECLSCIRDAIDEICVVDTGSTDNTREIARRFDVRLRSFLWYNDFSAARNESLYMCTGDWVFILDADERVAREDLRRLRALAQGPQDSCYRFITRNYTNSKHLSEFHACPPDDPNARGLAGWYPSGKVRLFPNGRGAKFEGKVHELVSESLERAGIRTVDTDIPIHHYAQLREPERIQRKQRMYLELGHTKIQQNPDDPKAYVELGNQYVEAGDHASAAGAYREALKRAPSNPEILKNLGGVLHVLGRDEEAKEALQIALRLDPSLADAWRNLGVIWVGEKQWPNAIECFRRGLELDDTWPDGRRYLSIALEGNGHVEEAAEASRAGLERFPNHEDYLHLYVQQMLHLERRVEARDVLLGLIGGGADLAHIHNAVGELCFYDQRYEEAKSHFRAAGERGFASAYNNLGVVLSKERHYAGARDAFEACLAADPGHRGARSNLAKVVAHLRAAGLGRMDSDHDLQ